MSQARGDGCTRQSSLWAEVQLLLRRCPFGPLGPATIGPLEPVLPAVVLPVHPEAAPDLQQLLQLHPVWTPVHSTSHQAEQLSQHKVTPMPTLSDLGRYWCHACVHKVESSQVVLFMYMRDYICIRHTCVTIFFPRGGIKCDDATTCTFLTEGWYAPVKLHKKVQHSPHGLCKVCILMWILIHL